MTLRLNASFHFQIFKELREHSLSGTQHRTKDNAVDDFRTVSNGGSVCVRTIDPRLIKTVL